MYIKTSKKITENASDPGVVGVYGTLEPNKGFFVPGVVWLFVVWVVWLFVVWVVWLFVGLSVAGWTGAGIAPGLTLPNTSSELKIV